MKILCSFCEDPIERDRYTVGLKLERQDFPPSGKWQEFLEHARENVCRKCYVIITDNFGHLLEYLRENKGKL